MFVTFDHFRNALRQSRIIPQEKLAAACQQYNRLEAGSSDALKLAQFLVKQSLLTKWQARKLLQGKSQGFHLGQYQLNDVLGRGGMSTVYLAEHRLMRRACAVKVLPIGAGTSPSLLQRFQREARAAGRLNHPNIVRAFDSGSSDNGDHRIHYIVMEYVNGQTLFEVVKRKGTPGFRQAAEVIRQAARGLAHAHAAGLVHRDIKPENLLVDEHGVVRIMDFGLALVSELQDESITVQNEGRVLGTANYCAPEQAVNSHRVDTRADMYSLGCTLYFLLTGRPPFHTGSLTKRLMDHQRSQPQPVTELRANVPAGLVRLLNDLMQKQPAKRIQCADEVVRRLDRMLEPAGAGAESQSRSDSSVPSQLANDELALAIRRVDQSGPTVRRPRSGWKSGLSRWSFRPTSLLAGALLMVGIGLTGADRQSATAGEGGQSRSVPVAQEPERQGHMGQAGLLAGLDDDGRSEATVARH